MRTGGWPCGTSSFIDWETEAPGRTCLTRSFMGTVGNRPLGIQSGLWAVPLLSVGSASGMGSPADLSLTPASAAPRKRQGYLRTGAKGPPAPEHWGLLTQTVNLNQQTALSSRSSCPSQVSSVEVFQEYPCRGRCAPKMKRLSPAGSLPFSTHWCSRELICGGEEAALS